MSPSWSKLCEAAQDRPLLEQRNDLYAWGGILVGCRLLPIITKQPGSVTLFLATNASLLSLALFCFDNLSLSLQVSSFAVCAVVQAVAFFRWHKQDYEAKQRDWPERGWFTGLACIGTFMGALAYGARIGHLNYNYATQKIEFLENRSAVQSQQMNEWRAWELRFLAAYFALTPFESCFVVFAKLQVLHRMQRLAVVNSLSERAWSLAGSLFLVAVISGLIIGVVANFVAAV
jgi:hypothetical protein